MTEPIFLISKSLNASEEGLYISTERWLVIRQTDHFYFCVNAKTAKKIVDCMASGDNAYDYAHRHFPKEIKKTKKDSRRFAFETEHDAFEYLVYMKGKHLGHIQRSMAFCVAFLDAAKSGRIHCESVAIPGTTELVHEYMRWD